MMPAQQDGGALAGSLAELKAYLRIESEEEDAVLAGLMRSAATLCEHFIGQWLIVRDARETVAGDGAWQRLGARPVVTIGAVEALDEAGEPVALATGDYAIDIDAAGEGWVRATQAGAHRLLSVRYSAGMAGAVNDLPEPIRQGIIRLAAEHFSARGSDGAAPPAVVSALWRPWRRMRLS